MALQQLAAGHLHAGIALLKNNFEAGDFALCARHLKPIDDADQAHHLGEELLGLCKAHPGAGAGALDCLAYVYECSPCSSCRKQAVRAWVATNSVPAWVRAECALDADPETRALVGAAPGTGWPPGAAS